MAEFDRKDFHRFLDALDFLTTKDNAGIQQLLQFFCLHGVKENEFASVLALYLQKYSRESANKFTTVVNSSLPKFDGKLIKSLPNTVSYSLTTIDNSDKEIVKKIVGITRKGLLGRSPVSDIQLFGLDEIRKHIIELKTDRRQRYLGELARHLKSGEDLNSGCLKKLVADLKTLASLQAFSLHENVVFWQGVLTYSFHKIGSPFPKDFPKYIKDESKVNNRLRLMPAISAGKVNEEWFKKCDSEVEQLKSQLSIFLSRQNYLAPLKEIHSVEVARGVFRLHDNESDSGSRVLVKSELLIFEVEANKRYLKRIAPLINNFYTKALDLDSKRAKRKKKRNN